MHSRLTSGSRSKGEVSGGGKPMSTQSLEDTLANFERLSRPTAQRVVRFWQARPEEGREAS